MALNKLKEYEKLINKLFNDNDIVGLYKLRSKLYYLDMIVNRDLTIKESNIKNNILRKITDYIKRKK